MGKFTNYKMRDIVELALEKFNKKFEKDNALFRINGDPDKYYLKASKKNGFPKLDMPSFDPDTTLSETAINRFTLVWRDKPDNYEIYFERLPKHRNINNNCNDSGCLVF